MNTKLKLATTALIAMTVAACGQKGPLVKPDQAKKAAPQPAATTTTPTAPATTP